MSEFIEVLSDQALKDIDQLINKIDKATKAQKDFNNEAKQYVTPSGASATTQKARRETQKLNEAQKESVRLSRALSRQKAKLEQAQGKVNRELIKLRYETQQTNRLEKQRAIISSRLSTEYQKQQAKINILAERYRELATRQELGIKLSQREEKELRDVTAQINRKQTALKRVDANMKVYNRNVGNYRSAWGSMGGLVRNAIAAFGAFAAIDIARQVFNQTKEINALNKALQQVTDTQQDFNQATDFLVRLADRTGSGINELQRAYVKFFAASKTTNLSLEDTQELFENVSTAAAVLGQSTEDTEGALRALEQMLSKGKVQAEEIRGQLGERLPGAFQILAKAMGLSTAELSKQLELGNVYADEVLPKFAKELAKTYSLDNVKKVETLAAAQGRLGNEWNLFIRDLEGGQGALSGVLTFFIESLSTLVGAFRDFTNSISNAFSNLKPLFETINNLFVSIFGEGSANKLSAFLKVLSRMFLTEAPRSFAKALKLVGATLNGVLTSAMEVGIAFKELSLSFARFFAQIASFDITNPFESIKNIDLTALRNSFLNIGVSSAQGFKTGFNQVWNFEAAITNDESGNANKKVEEQGKKLGRKLAQSIAKGLQENDPNVILSDASSLLSTVPVSEMEDYANATDQARKNTEKLLDALQKVAEKQLLMSELQGLGDMFGIDVGKIDGFFNEYEDKATAAALTATEVFSGVGQTIFAAEQQRLENQIALNNDYYNNLIQQAQGNEQQQALLRQEQARKERQLRREQAQNEKKSALFEIALSTAAAVVKALPNVPLSIAVGAIGAAKAALVASQPIPQYKTGRQGGKEEFAILGDGYKNEPIVDKDGNLKGMSPNRPTLMHLDQGDSVLPDVNRLNDDVINKTMLYNIQASANQMASQKDQNKGLEKLLAAQGYNIEKSIIKSLKKAKFVNNNNTKVDLGHQFKVNKYKGK